MKNKMYNNEEELIKDLKEEFGEDWGNEEEVVLWKKLRGENGVLLFVNNEMFEDGVFVMNEKRELYGFIGNNCEVREFELEKCDILGLLIEVLN